MFAGPSAVALTLQKWILRSVQGSEVLLDTNIYMEGNESRTIMRP